jgi:hypothetical protein
MRLRLAVWWAALAETRWPRFDHKIAPRLRSARGGKHSTVDNPQHPGRTYTMGSLLVALIVAAAFVFALLMGVHSFA